MLDLIPIPGHSKASVALYDRRTGVLLGGDTVYPGRIYVNDFSSFEASLDRLVKFTQGKPIANILGNHIEQSSTPFLDYPVGTMYQPNEHELALSRGTLLEEDAAVKSMHGTPRRYATRDLSIWPVGPRLHVVRRERSVREACERRACKDVGPHCSVAAICL